jgi:hypothetical protein
MYYKTFYGHNYSRNSRVLVIVAANHHHPGPIFSNKAGVYMTPSKGRLLGNRFRGLYYKTLRICNFQLMAIFIVS